MTDVESNLVLCKLSGKPDTSFCEFFKHCEFLVPPCSVSDSLWNVVLLCWPGAHPISRLLGVGVS